MRNDISLIFDIDDTLYSQMAPLLEACEESLGGRLADPELFYQAFGKRSQEMFLFSESGQISLHQSRIYRIENTMKDLGIPFTNEQAEIFQKRYSENQSHLHISPVLSQMLDWCADNGIRMGVMTNGPYKHQLQKFHTLGLDRWFTEDQLMVSADVDAAKPDVRIFRMAEERWKLIPENTYMIGDSLENDIAGAKAAGWKTVWMNHHRYSLPAGMEEPDHVAYTEEELKELIGRIIETVERTSGEGK